MFGEHDTLNVGVVGSSPTGTTDKRSITDGLSIALFLCVPKIEQGWFPRQAQIQYPQTTTPSVCVPFSVSMLRMEHHPGGGSAIHLLLYPHGMHSWFDNRPSRQIGFRKELPHTHKGPSKCFSTDRSTYSTHLAPII